MAVKKEACFNHGCSKRWSQHFQTNHLASGGKRLIQQTLGAHIWFVVLTILKNMKVNGKDYQTTNQILFQQFSAMQSHVCMVSKSPKVERTRCKQANREDTTEQCESAI